MTKARNRIISLDILKFICAILIVFHHFQQATGIRFNNINFFGGRFYVGYLVELFFIISGFVYTYNYKKTDFSFFIKNKITRIYPMAILSIIFIYIVEIFNYVIFGSAISKDGLGIWKIFSNMTLIFSMGVTTIDGIGINNPLWYCGVLMECYVLYYIVNVLTDNQEKNRVYVYIFICLLFLGLKTATIVSPFLHNDAYRGLICFSIGSILSILVCDVYYNKKLLVVSILVFTICLLLYILKYDLFFDREWEILVFIVYPSLIYIFLYINKYISNIRSSLLGNMSFEMYVWHPLFNRLFLTLKRSIIIDLEKSPSSLMFGFTLVVILFAFFISKYIEPKLTKYTKKLMHC